MDTMIPIAAPSGSDLVQVIFDDGPLGVTLRRRNNGTVYVHDRVAGSQAMDLDIVNLDELWQVGEHLVAFDKIDSERWTELIEYIKVKERPLLIVFRRDNGDVGVQERVGDIGASTSTNAEKEKDNESDEEITEMTGMTGMMEIERGLEQLLVAASASAGAEVDTNVNVNAAIEEEEESTGTEDEDEEDEADEADEEGASVGHTGIEGESEGEGEGNKNDNDNDKDKAEKLEEEKQRSKRAVELLSPPKPPKPPKSTKPEINKIDEIDEIDEIDAVVPIVDEDLDLDDLEEDDYVCVEKDDSQTNSHSHNSHNTSDDNNNYNNHPDLDLDLESFIVRFAFVNAENQTIFEKASKLAAGANAPFTIPVDVIKENGSIAQQILLSNPNRKLIRHGIVDMFIPGTVWSSVEKRHFFLLNDALLISNPVENTEILELQNMIKLTTCKVDRMCISSTSTSSDDKSFQFHSAQGFIEIICSSLLEKESWLYSITNAIFENIGEEERVFGWKHQYYLGTLHSAVITRDIDRVRELLENDTIKNIELNRRDDAGFTPLIYSCILRLANMTKLLLEKGAGVLDIMGKDRNGLCAIHWAAIQLDNVTLSYLTSNIVAGVDVPDSMERSALALACVEGKDRTGSTDPIQLRRCLTSLLACQASPDGILPLVSTPVQYLAGSWQHQPMESLIAAGASMSQNTNADGYTALHYCCGALPMKLQQGLSKVIVSKEELRRDIFEEPIAGNGIATLQALLAGGSYPNSKSTPLSLLCDNKNKWDLEFSGAITILLSHGARLDTTLSTNQLGELKDLGFQSSMDAVIDQWQSNSSVNGDIAKITLHCFVPVVVEEEKKEEESKNECQLCSLEYSFFKRQHHCRLCAASCCDSCSKKQVIVEKKALRTCDACFNRTLYKVNKSLEQTNRNRNSSAEIPTGTGSPNAKSQHSRLISSAANADAYADAYADGEDGDIYGSESGVCGSDVFSGGAASPRNRNISREQQQQQQQVIQAKSELFQGSNRQNSKQNSKRGESPSSSSSSSSLSKSKNSIGDTRGALEEVGDRLRERGEKLAQLDDKSRELANATSDFAQMAKQLNEQQKSRWF